MLALWVRKSQFNSQEYSANHCVILLVILRCFLLFVINLSHGIIVRSFAVFFFLLGIDREMEVIIV
jgi:hypothetical protein